MKSAMMKHDGIVTLFTDLNLFDYTFWDKTQPSQQRENIKKIIKLISENYGKDHSTKQIKHYKKRVKDMHTKLPKYQIENETNRKKKDIIPDDFISDDERKEEEFGEFKPPKPIDLTKRASHVRRDSNGKQKSQNLI